MYEPSRRAKSYGRGPTPLVGNVKVLTCGLSLVLKKWIWGYGLRFRAVPCMQIRRAVQGARRDIIGQG
jgi:hypothetical protein